MGTGGGGVVSKKSVTATTQSQHTVANENDACRIGNFISLQRACCALLLSFLLIHAQLAHIPHTHTCLGKNTNTEKDRER